jgi:predicted NAD/FAD-binding protein
MRIGIVGSGISGLICAYLLQKKHQVSLFEADSKPGGHVNTVTTKGKTGTFQVDTGFIVFNQENYPNFVRLLDKLEVPSQKTRMGFSVKSDTTGIEYNGESLTGLFGHLRNITNPGHWGMVLDILKFHKLADTLPDPQETVDQFIIRTRLGKRFRDTFLLPLGSALWSCPVERFGQFPMEFVTDFLSNHQMLQANNRPIWRVIKGGSNTYVKEIIKPLGDRLKLNSPVKEVSRNGDAVTISFPDGTSQHFDEVILACHADQSLRMLSKPQIEETSLLSSFPYEDNLVTLHSDDSILPRRKSARASWNAYLPKGRNGQALVSYDMNILQSLPTPEPFCVTLNQDNQIDSSMEHANFNFSHPTYHAGRKKAQLRHAEFIRRQGISFCGAYWGFGFHEDGLTSGLQVCEAFGEKL